MFWKTKWYQKAKEGAADFVLWGGAALLFLNLVARLPGWREWGNSRFFIFIRENTQVLWLVGLSFVVFGLMTLTLRLRQQLLGGYRDKFRNLDGWDYKGAGWRLKNGVLSVEGSYGFTKIGAHWENYTFTFKAKIIDKCLGVIVRANDPNNYYMFQIKPNKIRPHRRVAVPVVVNDKRSAESEEKSSKLPIIQYTLTWQMDHNNPEFKSIPIKPTLDDWFDVKIIVRGQSLNLFIGESFENEWPSLLQIPTGKVGFRNAGTEKAYVKDVRVTLQP